MKKILPLLLIWAFCASLSAESLYSPQKIAISNGKVQTARFGKSIFEDSFTRPGIWNEEIQNYRNLLHFTIGEDFLGAPCFMVSGKDVPETDTAWSVKTNPIQLTEKRAEFALTFEICSDASVRGEIENGKTYTSFIEWFDAENQPCGEQKFGFTSSSARHFKEIAVYGKVPEKAVSCVIQFGFDRPNVTEGKIFALRNVTLSMLDPEVSYSTPGTFISEIYSKGKVSWKADEPEGTKVQFQVSVTEALDGKAPWSDFVGPDGTSKTFYSEPFTVDAPFFRCRAILTPNGKQSPTLQELTVGEKRTTAWSDRENVFPPRVKIVSQTPTQNLRAELVLEITNEAPILWNSLSIQLDEIDVTDKFTRNGSLLTFKPETDWTPGLHRVNVFAENYYKNAVNAKKVFFIGETPKTPKVTMRDDGLTLIDGEPFFPIGIYGVMKREFNDFDLDKAFAGLKEAGFNFAHSYACPRTDEFLAAAEKYGFKLWTVAHSVDDRFIEIERHHPAILFWYLGDDTSTHATPSEVFDRYDNVRALDPTRLTTQADGVHAVSIVSNYQDYVWATDNFLPEIYPVRKNEPFPDGKCVPNTIRDMKRCWSDIQLAGAAPRSVFPIIQYFKGWGWERFPTNQELRAMSYASIIHGAHGITWYTYGGTVEPEKKKFNYGITTSPEIWKNICTLATQIKQLSPILVERTPEQPCKPRILQGPEKDELENDSISVLLKKHNGKSYLLCVNSTLEPVKAELTIPNCSKCREFFENQEFPISNGKLTVDFPAYGVFIFEAE